jgi:hypothetical protein
MCFRLEQISLAPVYRCNVPNVFSNDGLNEMKWYYAWRLKRVRATISALKEQSSARLIEDYTVHSRTRVLERLAEGLQRRLAKYSPQPAQGDSKEAC